MRNKSTQRILKKLADELSKDIDPKNAKTLETMISRYQPDIGFNLFDRTPWTTNVSNGDKLTLTNYWWAGFRDKHHDPMYFFLKTWGHAGNENLAKQWLQTYLKGFSVQEQGAFESKFWGLTATRLVQDLAESKQYPTQDQFKRYQHILNLFCKKDFKLLLP